MKYLLNVDTGMNATIKPTGDSFNCTIILSNTHRRVRAVTLKNAQIPLGFYNVRAPYNTIVINGVSYTMPPGNYSGTQFLNALNSTVTSAVGTFSIAAANNLYTFVPATGSATITTNLTNPPNLGNLLGFSNGVTGTSITATNSYINNFDTYLNIWIQNLATSSQETNQCTFKIPITVSQGAVLQWAENAQNECRVNVTDSSAIVDRLIVTVTDRYGQLINNNGIDWSMTLEIESDT